MTRQHELLDAAIKQVGNRYIATMLMAKRIRQLLHGAPPYVERIEGDSPFSIAMREIAEGRVIVEDVIPTDKFGGGIIAKAAPPKDTSEKPTQA